MLPGWWENGTWVMMMEIIPMRGDLIIVITSMVPLTRYVDDPVDTSRFINKHLPWAFSELPAWTPRAGATAIREGRDIVKDTGYLTFSFAEKGVEFIEKNKDHPFFLTLTFNAPHDPFQVPRDYFDRHPECAGHCKACLLRHD